MNKEISAKPKVIITTGLGINSHEELGYMFKLAGADVDFVLANELIANPGILDSYNGAGFAGGFAMGDRLGAGQSLANRIRMSGLHEKLDEKLNDPNFPIYAVCNHLQVFAKLDVFPVPVGTLRNDSGKHETGSWDISVNKNCKTAWLEYLKDYDAPIFAPISHGEGRINIPENLAGYVKESGLVALTYTKGHMCNYHASSRGERYNPNGSAADIAGFGWSNNLILFPHFERLHHNYQRDDKALVKSGEVPAKLKADTPDGLYEPSFLMFKAAVDFMKSAMISQLQ